METRKKDTINNEAKAVEKISETKIQLFEKIELIYPARWSGKKMTNSRKEKCHSHITHIHR